MLLPVRGQRSVYIYHVHLVHYNTAEKHGYSHQMSNTGNVATLMNVCNRSNRYPYFVFSAVAYAILGASSTSQQKFQYSLEGSLCQKKVNDIRGLPLYVLHWRVFFPRCYIFRLLVPYSNHVALNTNSVVRRAGQLHPMVCSRIHQPVEHATHVRAFQLAITANTEEEQHPGEVQIEVILRCL